MTYERGMKAVFGYALILLFLLSYRQLYWEVSKKVHTIWLLIEISIIFILSVWYFPYYIFMGFFPANFIGFIDDEKQYKRMYVLFAVIFSAIAIYHVFTYSLQEIAFIFLFLVIILISPFGIRSMYQRLELEKQLEQANEQIKELIKREERMRIARDLHDTLGHTFSLITLQSQLVQRLIDVHPEQAKEEANKIELTSRSALRQVRELVADMRAVTMEEELQRAKQILEIAGIQFHLTEEGDNLQISPLEQNIIGLCLREAITNVVKHSQGKNCFVNVHFKKGMLTLTIQDDGIGFNEQNLEGSGIQGMKERLALIDGTVEITNQNGTLVEMNVPIKKKQEEISR